MVGRLMCEPREPREPFHSGAGPVISHRAGGETLREVREVRENGGVVSSADAELDAALDAAGGMF